MTYWEQPADLNANWAGLRDRFEKQAQGFGGHQMRVSILVSRGMVTQILAPTFVKMEPISQNGRLQPKLWWNVIRRLKSAAPAYAKAAVSTSVWLDASGQPLCWESPEVRPLEMGPS